MYWLLSNHDDDSNGYIVDDEASVSSPVWFLAIPNGPETGDLRQQNITDHLGLKKWSQNWC